MINNGTPRSRGRSRQRRKRPIQARTLNELLTEQPIGQGGPLGNIRDQPARLPLVRQFKIDAIKDDWLECNTFDGVTTGIATVLVMRPYLLRVASITLRNGITYTKVNAQERTATKTPDTETQVVIPSYVIGDIIYGVEAVVGMDHDSGAPSFTPIVWLDINADGRAWAEK